MKRILNPRFLSTVQLKMTRTKINPKSTLSATSAHLRSENIADTLKRKTESSENELDFFKRRKQYINNSVCKPKVEENENPPWSHMVYALDCEMVECLYSINSLARCSVVDYWGSVVLDLYVKQTYKVTDYRTKYSGIQPKHVLSNDSISFEQAQSQVLNLIKNKIVIGHSLYCDTLALKINLPTEQTVDISKLPLVREKMNDLGYRTEHTFSLKKLSRHLLNRKIQTHTHCSVEDATATMDIFKSISHSWYTENQPLFKDYLSGAYFDDRYWPSHVDNNP
ncbi:interferon-stimulated gene 20 kDa protein-like [Ciona intestinalis]